MGLWPVKVFKLQEIAFFVYCSPGVWPVFTSSRGITDELFHCLAKLKLLNRATCITHANTNDKNSKNVIEYLAEGWQMSPCQTLHAPSGWNHQANAVAGCVGTIVILLTFRAVRSGLSSNFNLKTFIIITFVWDLLCGLVVRVPGYRSRGTGFDSRLIQIFWEVVGLERGPLSLLRIIEELLECKSSGSGLENRY
jgi:hypothetical protein